MFGYSRWRIRLGYKGVKLSTACPPYLFLYNVIVMWFLYNLEGNGWRWVKVIDPSLHVCLHSCLKWMSYYYSTCLLFWVSRAECILVIWCLKASTLCSMVWFEEKFIVFSVVVGFRCISFLRVDILHIMSRSRELIQLLILYVGLSCLSVCTWFIYVLIRSGFLLVVSYKISTSST